MQPKLDDLTIEITQQCPNNCLFCSSQACINSDHVISRAEVNELAKQAAGLGLTRLALSGGEPLFHPEIVGIVQDIVSQGLRAVIYTTGVAPSDYGRARAYLDWAAFDNHNTTLIFSVQSTQEKVHDKLTGHRGLFRLTQASIHNAKLHGFLVEVHIIPNRLNLASLESSVGDLACWGVDRVSFLRLVPQGNARDHLDELLLRADELEILKAVFHSLSEKSLGNMSLRFGVPFAGVLGRRVSCNAGQTKLIIRYDGKVFPCEAFKDCGQSEFSIGNIRRHTLEDLLLLAGNCWKLNELRHMVDCNETCPAQLLYHQDWPAVELS